MLGQIIVTYILLFVHTFMCILFILHLAVIYGQLIIDSFKKYQKKLESLLLNYEI